MQKLYRLVQAITFAVLLIIQHSLQAQNCCLDCQGDVKVITNNKILLEKIDLKEGTSTTLNANLYVSYRSGNAQKFWANVAIATAAVAVSTQLNNGNLAEGKIASSISPIVPLSVSVATLPSIWKNRPRGVPDTKIEIQHKDVEGNVLKTWTQAISKSARNDAELLNIALNEPLSKGTVEISLINESKNSVYYWGYEGIKQIIETPQSIFKTPNVLALNETKPVSLNPSSISSVFALSKLLPKRNDGFNPILKGPKTPIWVSESGDCPVGEHIGSNGYCQPDGSDLNGVTVTGSSSSTNYYSNPFSMFQTVMPMDPQGDGGGGNSNGNNPPKTKAQNCAECKSKAEGKYYPGLNRLNWYLVSELAACQGASFLTGVKVYTDTELIELLSPVTEGGASAAHAAIAVLAGFGFDIFCTGGVIFNYLADKGDLENEYYKDKRDCNSSFGCGF